MERGLACAWRATRRWRPQSATADTAVAHRNDGDGEVNGARSGDRAPTYLRFADRDVLTFFGNGAASLPRTRYPTADGSCRAGSPTRSRPFPGSRLEYCPHGLGKR